MQRLRNLAAEQIKSKSPWAAPPPRDVKACGVHFVGLMVYSVCLLVYSVHIFLYWANMPEVETFSSQEALQFGPVPLQLRIECPGCTPHASKDKLWTVKHIYDDFQHCASAGSLAVNDQAISFPVLCRTTDDIANPAGVTVWLGNLSENAPRAQVIVTQEGSGALKATTYLEHWHEKTLIFGLAVRRDKEDCFSSSDCTLMKELFVSSMQYDGKVDWGGDNWGGAQLNVRLSRFANVYTRVPKASVLELLASIGGASGLLIATLAVPVVCMERVASMRGGTKTVSEESVGG